MTRRSTLLSLALLVVAIVVFAPHRFTDSDTLSRLATGRYVVTHATFPRHDPFTFARPEAPLGHPEWLGDVIAYECVAHFGEGALQALVLALITLGFVLAFACALDLGAPAPLALALLLITLSASAGRFAARNDIHALWLLPLFSWITLRARSDRAWFVLLALGALWSNLHSSFVLGWVLVLGALIEDWMRHGKLRVVPAAVLLAYPLLPLLGPAGGSAYLQLWDHALGAPIYRGLLSEWQSPLTSPALLAILPLHVLTLLGVICIAAARPRPRVPAIMAFVLGVALAYSSRRFLPFMAVLMVPAVAGGVATWFGARTPLLRARAMRLAVLACAAYLALGLRSALRRPDAHVLTWLDAPTRAAGFIAAHAPAGAKLFNAFDDGPWLLWLTAPRVQHYIDPRNHLGAAFLDDYVHGLLRDTDRFDAEALRAHVSLVLVRERDPRMQELAVHLSDAPEQWPLVYWDGEHALHARRSAANAALIEHYAYRVLRPSYDVSYLAAPDRLMVAQDALLHDLDRLRAGSAAAASAIEAALVIEVGGDNLDHAQAESAVTALQAAAATLPPSPALMEAIARALQVAGRPL